jgi:hypothetical protein
MAKRPVAFRLGMWVSLILAILTAGFVLALLGWANPLLVLVAGLLLGGVFWWLLRPVFLLLSAATGNLMSPVRREFKRAWKQLGCKEKLVGVELTWLWANDPEGRRGGLPFYHWLKIQWELEKATTGVSANEWLRRLLSANEEGRVVEYWHSRPNVEAARMHLYHYIARRIGQFRDE